MNDLEEKLKLENDIASARRELKNTLFQLESVKNEYKGVVTLVENNKKSLEENKKYLQEVLNDIASAKISWLQEKNEEVKDLENKNFEANNILKRISELAEEKAEIVKISNKNQDILNEIRRIEFKMEQDKTVHQVKMNALKEKEVKHENEKAKLLKDKQDLREQVAKVLKQIEKI